MNIGINALILSEEKTGISVYAKNLIENLLQTDVSNHYYIFVSRKIFFRNFHPQRHHIIQFYTRNPFFRMIIEQFLLPFLAKCLHIHVLHCLSFTAPIIKTCKYVVTIHDLAYRIFPDTVSKIERLYYDFFFPICARKADAVIAVSENTKKDIIRFFKVKEKKIQVIFLGHNFSFPKEVQKTGMPQEYILFLGAMEPRKNLLRLIRAYALLKDRIREKLVLIGPRGSAYQDILYEIQRLHLQQDIVMTGYIEESLLSSILQKAKIFIFPSLYEGFGLPLLEAMAHGVPVITASNSCLPEVCKDCAIYINEKDEKNISEAIFFLLQNRSLRENLKQSGLQRSREFSWEKTAQETLNVYRNMAAKIC